MKLRRFLSTLVLASVLLFSAGSELQSQTGRFYGQCTLYVEFWGTIYCLFCEFEFEYYQFTPPGSTVITSLSVSNPDVDVTLDPNHTSEIVFNNALPSYGEAFFYVTITHQGTEYTSSSPLHYLTTAPVGSWPESLEVELQSDVEFTDDTGINIVTALAGGTASLEPL